MTKKEPWWEKYAKIVSFLSYFSVLVLLLMIISSGNQKDETPVVNNNPFGNVTVTAYAYWSHEPLPASACKRMDLQNCYVIGRLDESIGKNGTDAFINSNPILQDKADFFQLCRREG